MVISLSGRDFSEMRRPARAPHDRGLRHTVADVIGEHLVDQRLVADMTAARFLSERLEDAWINADRDQSPRFISDRRPTDSAHRLQLCARRLRNIRGGNFSRRTPRVRAGSLAAR